MVENVLEICIVVLEFGIYLIIYIFVILPLEFISLLYDAAHFIFYKYIRNSKIVSVLCNPSSREKFLQDARVWMKFVISHMDSFFNSVDKYATRKQYEIQKSQITLIMKIGEGSFGEVWKGQWKGRVDVAVKMLKPNAMSPEAFIKEAEMMMMFSHPNLVVMHGICTEQEPFYIITEYMCNGSLLDFLKKEEGRGTLLFESQISISAQVASGMAHLASNGLVHRDLAARNVLIGNNLIAKVADFGLARVIIDDHYSVSYNSLFPEMWTAPEAIQFNKFTVKSDVWSYGVLLWEIHTYGRDPYPGMIEEIKKQKVTSSNMQVMFQRIMLDCWETDPDKRPTFAFMAHRFKGIHKDWKWNEFMQSRCRLQSKRTR